MYRTNLLDPPFCFSTTKPIRQAIVDWPRHRLSTLAPTFPFFARLPTIPYGLVFPSQHHRYGRTAPTYLLRGSQRLRPTQFPANTVRRTALLFSGRKQFPYTHRTRGRPAAAPVRTPTFSSFFGFFPDLPQTTEPPYDGPVRQTLFGDPGRHSPFFHTARFFHQIRRRQTIDGILVCILVVGTSDNRLPRFILVIGTCNNPATIALIDCTQP